jgi:hypothetical protein
VSKDEQIRHAASCLQTELDGLASARIVGELATHATEASDLVEKHFSLRIVLGRRVGG